MKKKKTLKRIKYVHDTLLLSENGDYKDVVMSIKLKVISLKGNTLGAVKIDKIIAKGTSNIKDILSSYYRHFKTP